MREKLSPEARQQRSAILERRSTIRRLIINTLGATMTVSVLVIVTITKFTHGAYLVFIAIPILAVLMIGVNRYYRDVEHEIEMDDRTHFGSSGDVALILVNRLQKPVVKAIDYALAARHDKTIALHVAVTKEEARSLQKEWEKHGMPIPLVIIESPYRYYAQPVAEFIKMYREKHGSTVITVYLPQYIVGPLVGVAPAQPARGPHRPAAHAHPRRHDHPRAVAAGLVASSSTAGAPGRCLARSARGARSTRARARFRSRRSPGPTPRAGSPDPGPSASA